MSLNGNWIDLVILFVLFFFVLDGWGKGFWILITELFSFLGALLAAIRFYPLAANFLEANFALTYDLSNALGFLIVAIFAEAILGSLAWGGVGKIPKNWSDSLPNKILGIIPAVLNGLVLIAFVLTCLIALPVSPYLKKDVFASRFGGSLIGQTTGLEHKFKEIFGGALEEALAFLTVKPESTERVDLRFTTKELSVDGVSETKMFTLVNEERRKQGLKELAWDLRLVTLAQVHSQDMFERGYFSHYSPEGESIGDRLKENKIDFLVAGENLAYAPSVLVAHNGLMASPGHRRNILSSEYGRIGIGVIDGGIYSKMFVQVFTN